MNCEIPDASIPVFDKAKALEVIDGDEAFLKELAAEFLIQADKTLLLIMEAAEKDDPTLAERAAHNLKSMSAHLGGMRLAHLAMEMEELSQKEDLAPYAAKAPCLAPELQELAQAFRREGLVP